MKSLHLILGDQLSHSISSLRDFELKNSIILMCEVWDEATYVKHHKKKIAFIFSAMRHFAEELRQKGYQVDYVTLDDSNNTGSFTGEVNRAIHRHTPDKIVVTSPGEYRVLTQIKQWKRQFRIPVEIRQDDRFLCSLEAFKNWADGFKSLRLESFYRYMRKKHSILMDGEKPIGGQWNYDTENRKPPKTGLNVPDPYLTTIDAITEDVIRLVSIQFKNHFGDLEPFYFAQNRTQALMVLETFIKERLPLFGDYQDAMLQGQPWLFHSHLSFYLNCGLLLPLECVEMAERAYRSGQAPLNAVEGFIRQIIGWREYVRGIYWMKMPDYAEKNYLVASRELPELYWNANTRMNCLHQCVKETKNNAYAHHIQRLMVLGNFALLIGVDPKLVNEWYLIVYADAYEWVELPNVTGMILFADGGFMASKPYAASGSYINKMSNYCKSCSYEVTQKNGPDACPFNYLYWDFLARNREKLHSNHRIGMMLKTYDKMGEEKHTSIRQDSERFLKEIEQHSHPKENALF